MQRPMFLESVDARGVAHLKLTRGDVHNAFNDQMIAELTLALEGLASDPRVRLLLLTAEGKSFSAGADLNWMKSMVDYSEEENRQDSLALAKLMKTLNDFPQPTLALVQGPAYGGGVGLVACCDIALAAEAATFCLSEVKLGLIPAVISPYVVAAMGQRAARRYFVTAERFSAQVALDLGLVHDVVNLNALEHRGDEMIKHLLAAGPNATKEAKRLVLDVANRPIEDDLIEETARRIAAIRLSKEGQEGLAAFFDKRLPNWHPKD